MTLYALPALFALFVWWFSTGAIMFLDGLPPRTFRWSMLGATVVLALSLWGLARTAHDATLHGAYGAFTCGLLAWGWQEISFYMGYVTGPRRAPCPENCRGWRHFGHAIQTSLWHELAIVALAAIVVALTWHAPNRTGLWTFMVLWWMHQSAKLNVFLGVRNLNEEFLPAHLQFLRSFLTKKPMNLLFPVSITVSTVILVRLVEQAADGSRFGAASSCFLATLMALAILEHWLLVLPLPASALWGWSLRSRKGGTTPVDVEIVAGFLGAGKTTFLRARLLAAGPRTVVLVNDFATLGIDAALLRPRGSEVVELPNGCICCSLRGDLVTRLTRTLASFSPERVLIEPSGVADLASLVAALRAPALRGLIRSLAVTTVLDAGAFLADWTREKARLEAQIRLASLLVVNKADLVGPAELMLVDETARGVNPLAPRLRAVHGLAGGTAPAAIAAGTAAPGPENAPAHAPHEHGHAHAHEHDHHAHPHAHHAESWSATLAAPVDPETLLVTLQSLARGRCGRVDRLKGIARAGAGWIRFDIAGGRPAIAAFATDADEQPRVIAIGRDLDTDGLDAIFGVASRVPEAA